jgi:hypothetical protein
LPKDEVEAWRSPFDSTYNAGLQSSNILEAVADVSKSYDSGVILKSRCAWLRASVGQSRNSSVPLLFLTCFVAYWVQPQLKYKRIKMLDIDNL